MRAGQIVRKGLFILGILSAPGLFAQTPSSQPPPGFSNILVGIQYFGGWWPPGSAEGKQDQCKWLDPRDGHDWRPEWPARIPTLGAYNSQQTMNAEIAAAAAHGVGFFSILWYPPHDPPELAHACALLNHSVDDFIHAPNAHLMKFDIQDCNSSLFASTTDQQWRDWVAVWVAAMKSPSYLRVGGRLVFVVHDGSGFYVGCGKSVERARARLDYLRAQVRQAGLGEMVIGGGNLASVVKPIQWAAKLFDFAADYMKVPPGVTGSVHPYPELIAYMKSERATRREDIIPYLPPLGVGWDPRPWHEKRPSFVEPTAAEWTAALQGMAQDVASGNYGIPRPDGSVQKAFVIYAWNEFGEGGFVAPTAGDGMMKLDAIQAVFGAKAVQP